MVPAAFGRLCVETSSLINPSRYRRPAAFGRLCVETTYTSLFGQRLAQPPSGGCVLKPVISKYPVPVHPQPPSGGCVLKRRLSWRPRRRVDPAAFGRLCVETVKLEHKELFLKPAAFGRLCVETKLHNIVRCKGNCQPPSGGCVLKQYLFIFSIY